MAKLDIRAFGLAVGFTWGIGVFAMALLAANFDWGTKMVVGLGSFYLGYEPTIGGSFVGLAWGLVDGTIAGIVVSWLYNKLAR